MSMSASFNEARGSLRGALVGAAALLGFDMTGEEVVGVDDLQEVSRVVFAYSFCMHVSGEHTCRYGGPG